MKILKLVLTLSLLLSVSMAKDEFTQEFRNHIAEYDKFFAAIGKKRVGVSENKINSVKNPFIMSYPKIVVKDGNGTVLIKKPTYVLTVIFDNKAKINGQWYKLNSELGEFKLASISSKSVIIKNEHSKKELFIRKSNVSKIKFSSK